MTGFVNTQDTINFKAFDTLKTSAEDKHKSLKNITFPADTVENDSVKNDNKSEEPPTGRLITSKDIVQSNNIQKDPDNWDVRLFRKINNNRSPFKDRFLDVFDRSMLPMAFLMPASTFIYGRAYDKTYDENTGYLLFASELTNTALTFGTKIFIKRKRPMNRLPHCYIKGKPALDVYSFPSGHTSTTFSIATMFTLRYPSYPLVYVPMYAWAVIVAYGRPYFGMHYPTDLLAGAVYGAGSSILIFSLRKELLKFKNNLFGEDKKDEGSINAGVLSLFVGSFIASSIINTVIFKPVPGKRLFISPWMDNKRSGLNINYKF